MILELCQLVFSYKKDWILKSKFISAFVCIKLFPNDLEKPPPSSTSIPPSGDINNDLGAGSHPVLICLASGVTFSSGLADEAAVLAEDGLSFLKSFLFIPMADPRQESGVVGVVAPLIATKRSRRCWAALKAVATTCSNPMARRGKLETRARISHV